MYVIRADMEILHKIQDLLDQYEAKFGERFIAFNYIDFPGTKTIRPAEQYRETLREALTKDEPTRIESHRYDIIDH